MQAFRCFDADGNGSITRDELLEVMEKLEPGKWDKQKVKALIKAVDVNRDGIIQYEEFIAWIFGTQVRASDKRGSVMAAANHEDTNPAINIVKPAWEVLTPATVLEKSRGGADRQSGYLLIFFDVDGVLNTRAEVNITDREDIFEMAQLAESEALGTKPNDSLSDHKGRWGVSLNRKCLRRLNSLMASFDEKGLNRARLVLSGTMRTSTEQVAFIRKALTESGLDVKKSLLGYTASLRGATRGEEVLHYLSELAAATREVAAWIVLDDDPANLESLGDDHKVETSEDTGLDDEATKLARDALAAQDAAWCSAKQLAEPEYAKEFMADATLSPKGERGASAKKKKPGSAASPNPDANRRTSARKNARASADAGAAPDGEKHRRPSRSSDRTGDVGAVTLPVGKMRRPSRSCDPDADLDLGTESSSPSAPRRRSLSGSAVELGTGSLAPTSPSTSKRPTSAHVASDSASGRGGRPTFLSPASAKSAEAGTKTLPILRRNDTDEHGEHRGRRRSANSPSASPAASPMSSARQRKSCT